MQSRQNAKGLGEWRGLWDLSGSHVRVEGALGPQLQPRQSEGGSGTSAAATSEWRGIRDLSCSHVILKSSQTGL